MTHEPKLGRTSRAYAGSYLVAVDTQLLVSHRNHLVRLFHTGTLNYYYSGDGRRHNTVKLVVT